MADVISPAADHEDHSKSAGAPAEEIDITPAMIEAGMKEYSSRWCGLRDADDDVAREMLASAYVSMMRAKPVFSREARKNPERVA
jgi:hypothetical protein